MPGSSKQEYLYLTTMGRRSGLPREVEIWFTELAGRYYLISERGRSAAWVRNIEANAAVEWRVGEQVMKGRARIVEAPAEFDLQQTISRLSIEKYGWGEGLVVELCPEQSRLS